MKKLLLGTIFVLGSVGIVSAQTEDRDPRAPKAEKAAPAATGVSAKQDDLHSSKNRVSQPSLRAQSKNNHAATTEKAVTATPQKSATVGTAAKSKKANTATPATLRSKNVAKEAKVETKSADVLKQAEVSKPAATKKN